MPSVTFAFVTDAVQNESSNKICLVRDIFLKHLKLFRM